jgi:succinate dehydrogenase / fumarate reductase cytochrome b subunit
MGLTGLGALGFLVSHLSGNMIYYLGEGAFNAYAAKLHSIPILPLAELGLVGLFLTHMAFGVWLTLENWYARPVRYKKDVSAGGSNIASSTMIWSGLLIFIFMALHVFGMKFSDVSALTAYGKVTAILTNISLMIAYVVGVVALGFHIFHGAASLFQSLGLRYPKYDPWVDGISRLAALGIAFGFISIPLFIYFVKGAAQ